MGRGNKAPVKAVRRNTFMRVVPTERPTFVKVLPPERFLPFEAAAGRLAIRKATSLPPLFSGRHESLPLVSSHTRSPTYRPTPAAGVERGRRRWCGPVKAEAAGQRRFAGGSRAVHGRFTGGLRAVRVCGGSAGCGKAAQRGERGRGTTVPRHETGRRGLGAVPSGGGPCLAGAYK